MMYDFGTQLGSIPKASPETRWSCTKLEVKPTLNILSFPDLPYRSCLCPDCRSPWDACLPCQHERWQLKGSGHRVLWCNLECYAVEWCIFLLYAFLIHSMFVFLALGGCIASKSLFMSIIKRSQRSENSCNLPRKSQTSDNCCES